MCLLTAAVGACAPPRASIVAPSDDLERYVAAVRRQATTLPEPPATTRAATFEDTDAALREARLRLEVAPTGSNHRALADIYARRGVFDAAYDHFTAALTLDPRDSAAYDGRARVWRDWGQPALGMNDAHRAVYYAPTSAAPLNTLGTLMLRLGLVTDAQRTFAAALETDPAASYARNNLCYVDIVQNAPAALDSCTRAQAAQPDAVVTRTNLAMALVLAGDVPQALRLMARSGSPALAPYDLGTALMALGHYPAAARAFDQAVALSPEFVVAADRALQARTLATLAPAGVRR